MKKGIFVFLFAVLSLNISLQACFACSDFLLNNSGDSIVSARTMDFGIPLQAEVVVVPRGEKCVSALSLEDTYLHWTSKYGFVGTNVATCLPSPTALTKKGSRSGPSG